MLREARLLVLLALVSALTLAFGVLASEMVEGETAAFDRTVLLLMHPLGQQGPVWLQEAARDITALGSHAVLSLVVLSVLGYMLLQRRVRTATQIAVAVAGGGIASSLLKALFARPRPDVLEPSAAVFTNSFPSGHSMLSAVVYLTLAALLASTEPRRRNRLYLLGCAIFFTLLVGTTRLYLGVHWPTDVLAGWLLGSAWAITCWIVAIRIRR